MIDKGFRVLKLILLGVIAVAIPILFIMQAEENEREKREKESVIQRANQAELQFKNDIIKLYSDLLIVTYKDTPDRKQALLQKLNDRKIERDTLQPIIFDNKLSHLSFGEVKDVIRIDSYKIDRTSRISRTDTGWILFSTDGIDYKSIGKSFDTLYLTKKEALKIREIIKNH